VRVVLFGSTGRTGLLLAKLAVTGGHEVTAFARDPARMTIVHSRLHVVRGDVLDAPSVDRSVRGQEGVLSALGPPARNPPPALSQGIRHILDAMAAHGVQRIVCMSAAGALREDAGFFVGNLGLRLSRLLLRGVYREHRRMLEEIQRRDVSWIVVRPVLLTNGPPTGRYRVALEGIPRWGLRISRADVAHFMIKQLTNDEYVRKMPAIAY